jgi:hypothetical protein
LTVDDCYITTYEAPTSKMPTRTLPRTQQCEMAMQMCIDFPGPEPYNHAWLHFSQRLCASVGSFRSSTVLCVSPASRDIQPSQCPCNLSLNTSLQHRRLCFALTTTKAESEDNSHPAPSGPPPSQPHTFEFPSHRDKPSHSQTSAQPPPQPFEPNVQQPPSSALAQP